VPVAAGGIQIQSARCQCAAQKAVGQLHCRQVRHAAAHQQPAARHKTELCRQRLRSGIAGIRQWRGEFAGGSPVKAAVLAQNLPQQIASVPAALPFRDNFQRFKTIGTGNGMADAAFLFI